MISKYKISDKIELNISEEVIKLFNKYRPKPLINKKEAGGILLGRVYAQKVVIENITEPSFLDKAGEFFFIRNIPKAQRAIDKSWKKTEGEQIYLGEWHTHNEDHPSPSTRDMCMIRNMLKDSIMEIDFLFLIILGRKNNYVGIQKGNMLTSLDSNLK